ncbi:MAG TPA: leucyl aminopeptidase family protein [Xanthobacteraceae bacterium]|nr:leucyl aminopeptidase family protein [Xanthobacteraceae bacterium]
MHPVFVRSEAADAVPIWFVTPAAWEDGGGPLDAPTRLFARAAGYEPRPGSHLLVPGANNKLGGVLFGIEEQNAANKNLFLPGKLAELLPSGNYRFANAPHDARLAALAFALGSYRFTRYRKSDGKTVRLEIPESVDAGEISRIVEAAFLARDLINTPANDMGPVELENAARDVATRFNAKISVVVGDDLLTRNFPLIHAVGRAAAGTPRLIDMTWGDRNAPKVTLVGKGVCFDSGGLDIKPDNAMLIMKKDMGGAANVLALAQMVMDAKLKIRLRVLIPAVENAISGFAMRPLDIYRSRKGITVEVGNTDAEGRLILADALALADEEAPELLIDMGTLTGAARVALGPELPPFYTDDEALAAKVAQHAAAENDPLWRLPLWQPYEAMLESKTADINNVSTSSFAGSITCALFMKRFVEAAKTWLHLDIYAWTPSAKPGRPEGGECQAARAIYALLKERYG